MGLQSSLFKGDPKLEMAAISDPAHIQTGAVGPHVGKIQQALIKLDRAIIETGELQGLRYGPSTAKAVLVYKQKRSIINRARQTQADAIAGQMTIASLDKELLKSSNVLPVSPQLIPVIKDWFVTELNLNTFSLVVFAGFTASTGTIKFERPNGDFVNLPIGLFGPSVGLSFIPKVGSLLKIPGVSFLLSRFPVLEKLLLNEKLLLFWVDTQFKILHALGPNVTLAIENVLKSLNGGLASFPSAAIGKVFGSRGREVQKIDFSGPCICYSIAGTVGPGNAGIFALFFGLDRAIVDLLGLDPFMLVDLIRLEAHAKGFAIISSASLSASLPGLGAGATIFFGEIV